MKDIYVNHIAQQMQVKAWQVENCALMFEQGDTIPFISRYRKERTGGLDDASVAEIKHWVDLYQDMEKRKSTILDTIASQDKLTDELKSAIENCVIPAQLEDLYLPYRPKRRTRATAAKEAGLEPLADVMYAVRTRNPQAEAQKYVGDKVPGVEEALAGARDIIAERLSETASVRETLRGIFRARRIVAKATKAAQDNPEAAKYRSYFNFSMPIQRIPAHNLLAILRAQGEGFLSVDIDADAEKCSKKLYYDFCQEHSYPAEPLAEQIRMAVEDSFKRLLEPSISNEIIKEAKEKADIESIKVFGENLTQLLLSAPLGQKRTMAVDPGFRNGCKIACLDEYGSLLHHTVIFPHPPQNQKVKAIIEVQEMLEKYAIQAVALGNGTASRETEEFFKKIQLPDGCKVWLVSEDGASIYSASEAARKEFPDQDVTVRGAVSIGRQKLDNTVEHCVNSVGVNLNTASPYLLSYVAGVGPALAANIVSFRDSNGGFRSRQQLLGVPRLGAKAFEQCAGFLRIRDAQNPLDNSAVHPEAYRIVDKMAADLNVPVTELIGNQQKISQIKPENYTDSQFGLPTVNDILKELLKPGLDPRQAAQEFEFAQDVHSIDDLKVGMELPGIVTNITNFGAFVDIGLHENGLIHASKMGVKGMADPSKILKLHQHVTVTVLQVDLDRSRISLGLVK